LLEESKSVKRASLLHNGIDFYKNVVLHRLLDRTLFMWVKQRDWTKKVN